MNILAICDSRNRKFRHDGDEFKAEMNRFSRHWESKQVNITTVETDSKKNWVKHNAVLNAIARQDGPIDVLALFCHGWASGISLGFRNWHINDLIAALHPNHKTKIVLYACSCMKNKNSFGPRLAKAMVENIHNDCEVIGHSTAGHVTKNPHTWIGFHFGFRYPFRPFIALGWWARRKSTEWKRWRDRMKTTDRFDFWADK